MSKKFLGKVIAGAALGGASLLICAPSAALADSAPYSDGHHRDALGRVYAKPHVVKPGHEVKLIEVCSEKQQHAWLWSKVTGKVDLKPKEQSYDNGAKQSEPGSGWDDKKSEQGADSWQDGSKPQDYEGGSYKQEQEYQEFLKYKEYQEYQEYRRYKEKKTPENTSPEQKKAPESSNSTERKPASPGSVPAAPKDSRGEQPSAGQSQPGGAGGGLRADGADGAGSNGWEGDKKAGQDSKKAEEYKPEEKTSWEDGKESEEYKAWQDSRKSGDHQDSAESDGWAQKEAPKHEYWASVKIPWDAKPGTYDLKGSCGEGELIIVPKGWVDGGDGGTGASKGDNLAVGGVGMLGLAALGGLVLMRQRRTDESPA